METVAIDFEVNNNLFLAMFLSSKVVFLTAGVRYRLSVFPAIIVTQIWIEVDSTY